LWLQFSLSTVINASVQGGILASILHWGGSAWGTGVFLSLDELLFSVDAIYMENPWWKTLKEAKAQSAENLLLQKVQCVNGRVTHVASSAQPGLKKLTRWQDMIRRAYQKRYLRKRRKKAYLHTDKKHLSYILKGGASGATNLLSLYLKIAEPTLQKDCKGSTPLLSQSFRLSRFSNSLCSLSLDFWGRTAARSVV
jgi:hypothetical protein